MRENNEYSTPLPIIETDSATRNGAWFKDNSERYIFEAREPGMHPGTSIAKKETALLLQKLGIEKYLKENNTEAAARLLGERALLQAEVNAESFVV